ncbi:MAG: hypothetical protein ACRCV5_17240, partial [Afipia sp.]
HAKRAVPNNETGIRRIALFEQPLAESVIALLGADRKHLQCRRTQQIQCRDARKQGDVVFNSHRAPKGIGD